MAISAINNNFMAIMPLKTEFAPKKLSEGTPLGAVNENGRFDTVKLSISAKETNPSVKPLEITHEPLKKVDLSRYEGTWAVTIYADGTIDDPMADYNRSQGNYRTDLWREILDMNSVSGVYDEALSSGMSKEQAWETQSQAYSEHMSKYAMEAFDLTFELIPPNENATGEIIDYSDVYDKNGKLKAPAKVSPAQYRENLQSMIENVMTILQSNQNKYPNLYGTHFGNK